MIELEEFINSSRHEQITAERMRKSSRLLRDFSSHSKMGSKDNQVGKCCKSSLSGQHALNWRHQKYSELLKLIRFAKEEKEQLTKSLDYNSEQGQECFNHHFKGWKPSLESEIIIAPCKELKWPHKLSTDLGEGLGRQERDYRKEKRSELNLFKFHLKKNSNRCQKKSKPSLAKILKIQDQPLPADLIINPHFIKEGVNLLPLRKAHERLLSMTPEKPKEELPERKSMPMKARKGRQRKGESNSFNFSKAELSAWTFHNIEQQR